MMTMNEISIKCKFDPSFSTAYTLRVFTTTAALTRLIDLMPSWVCNDMDVQSLR